MKPFTAAALYVLLWWLALFAVLPLGTRPVAEADDASGWRGAPAHPRFWRTVLITTLVAGVVWAICEVVVVNGWVDFRSGWMSLPNR